MQCVMYVAVRIIESRIKISGQNSNTYTYIAYTWEIESTAAT